MNVEIDLHKSLNENASDYFNRAKKLKNKIHGLQIALQETQKKAEMLRRRGQQQLQRKERVPEKRREREWYEKFHWFFSSDNYLVIAGRDAASNELLVKKYMEPSDVYFHSDLQGASHCIIKSTTNNAPEATKNEAAQFAAVFSKAWALGIAAVDVYSVAPEQVSKSAKSGEYLSKGAFAISGKREWYKKMKMELGAGVRKEKGAYAIISGPVSATEKHSIAFVRIAQDSLNRNELAKHIKAALEKKIEKFGVLSLDEINSMLPGGGKIA